MFALHSAAPSVLDLAPSDEVAPESERTLKRRAGRYRDLVLAHADRVRRVSFKLGIRGGDVDDLAQRVFLTTWRKLRWIEPGAEPAFLDAVVRREAGHVRRSYRRRGEVELDATTEPCPEHLEPEQVVACKAVLGALAAFIQEQGEAEFQVWKLHVLEGCSCEDIAGRLGWPLGTVKTRLRRARKLLSKQRAEVLAPTYRPQA